MNLLYIIILLRIAYRRGRGELLKNKVENKQIRELIVIACKLHTK